MSNSYSLDPSFQIAKVFVRLGMVFSALMAAISLYLIYLASLGVMNDWKFSIQTEFMNYFPEINSNSLGILFFSMPALGFVVCFFVLGWLGKKIQLEDKIQK